MNTLRGPSSRTITWVCRQCYQKRLNLNLNRKVFASTSGGPLPRRNYRGTAISVAVAGAIGIGGLYCSENVKHIFGAAERSSRVLKALTLNILDYRKVLKQETRPDERDSHLAACHQRCANRTLQVLEANGSMFIKLGQHLSSMGYLLPSEWTETFIPLQDKCPVSSYESIESLFLKDTGHPISRLFEAFDQKPIGSASLAQVHLATLRGTGQKVAVKVQHPLLEEWVPLDMRLTKLTFAALKYFFPEYDLEWLSNEMEQSLPQELDFVQEGKNATRAREYFSMVNDAPVIIPEVKWALKRILVMDFVTGHRPDDLDYLDSNHIDRDEVSAALSRIFNEMIFGDGAPLHCDPHGGNIAIRKNDHQRKPNFDVILYDHGLYRDIPLQLRRDYAKLWLAVIDSDEVKMRKYAKAVAGITDDQFPLFASAITGRDFLRATSSVVSSRSAEEKEIMSEALGDGLIQQLVQLLGSVPRIILLILKTNDLTRSLDENLHTRQGPVRTFMILARYCSRTVYQEQLEIIRQSGNLLWPNNLLSLLWAWSSYMRVGLKLTVYEKYLALRKNLGMMPLVLEIS